VLPPGAFILLGLLLALRQATQTAAVAQPASPGAGRGSEA
jgi:hypothetical protein